MKRILLTFIALTMIITVQAQSPTSADSLRLEAYHQKQKGNWQEAVRLYSQILRLQPGDYDARLALGRLYVQTEQYAKAEKIFRSMLEEDPRDAEALKGLGDAFLYTDRTEQAAEYYRQALREAPDYIPFLFALARAYAWSDRTEDAVRTYRRILRQDETYAEAWQGIGKMYYWENRPYEALRYYRKALQWYPESKEIQDEYRQILRDAAWTLQSRIQPLTEKEENYDIRALSHRFVLSKRLNDKWEWKLYADTDLSKRTYRSEIQGDTVRWYDAIALKGIYHMSDGRLAIFAGYAPADRKFSTYGAAWIYDFRTGPVKWHAEAKGGYDYYYYWNRIGHHKGEITLKARRGKWEFRADASGGITDKAFIMDVPADRYTDDYNPFYGAGAGISYRILQHPLVKAGASYDYLTYRYKSPRYYSPLDRHTAGPELSVYYDRSPWYAYLYASGRAGKEYYYEKITGNNGQQNPEAFLRQIALKAGTQTFNIEIGHRHKAWETAVSARYFHTPYYLNYAVSFHITVYVGTGI